MKKDVRFKLMFGFALVILSLFALSVSAAASTRGFSIKTGNTRAYASGDLSRGSGWVFDTDEVTFLEITDRYVLVEYPVPGGSRTGYVEREAFLLAIQGEGHTAQERVTTYIRPGGMAYGYVDAGDEVVIIGQRGDFVQLQYPVPSGYKIAFVTYHDYCRLIGSLGGSSVSAGEALYNEAKSHLNKRYGDFPSSLGFHFRAWCADFVSYCAANCGLSYAIPSQASVSGLRSAIKRAGGTEYSKSTIKRGGYVPTQGDIIIFKSNGASHVGIVDYASGGRIYYIDGNNVSSGSGYKASVHYSSCKYTYSKFTCVLRPAY